MSTQVRHSRVRHFLEVASQVTCSMKEENSVLTDKWSFKATSSSRTFSWLQRCTWCGRWSKSLTLGGLSQNFERLIFVVGHWSTNLLCASCSDIIMKWACWIILIVPPSSVVSQTIMWSFLPGGCHDQISFFFIFSSGTLFRWSEYHIDASFALCPLEIELDTVQDLCPSLCLSFFSKWQFDLRKGLNDWRTNSSPIYSSLLYTV